MWTHSQGVFPLRKALAELLRLPLEKVRCIHVEGSGCYGHNGADDVAADAALVARAVPGQPVRLQWMREQEHGWEPYGPAMMIELQAALDADGRDRRLAARRVEQHAHARRPVPAGSARRPRAVDPPFPPQTPQPLPMPKAAATATAIPIYALPNARGTFHFVDRHAGARLGAARRSAPT